MSLVVWSWIFLALYIGMMLVFGIIGQRKVTSGDDFATARSSYGPIFLAFAFAATTASGATTATASTVTCTTCTVRITAG